MTDELRWLHELPEDAPERSLLDAGRRDLPSLALTTQSFKALSAVIGATGIAASTTTAMAKTTTLTTSSTLTAKTTLSVLAIKPLLLGFVLGSSVIGTTLVIERHTQSVEASVPTTRSVQTAPPKHVPLHDAPPASSSIEKAKPPTAETENPIKGKPEISQPPLDTSISAPNPELSLKEQARTLAQIKRLMTATRIGEALKALEQTESTFAHTSLAEEHEALYVNALESTGRNELARAHASRFLIRFPNSPHREKMQKLLAKE
jgi:hypothetical protein